jgi:acetyl-CoA carboxylase, biotin carboxylase subunit
MRPKLAVQQTKRSPRCVILGPSEIARKIEANLATLGIESISVGVAPGDEVELVELLKRYPNPDGVAQWVHPGISSCAEKPYFPTIVLKAGMIPISQSAKTLSLYSNKVNFLSHGESLAIPHLAISLDPFHSAKEIKKFLEENRPKFPVLMKSIFGGAGFGSQLIRNAEELDEVLPVWLDQLRERYGDSTVIIERTLGSARHLIVPFASFSDGEIRFFPVIDGSLQSRWKRFIQFCPAIGIEEAQKKTIQAWTKKWADSLGYYGFGTLEFLLEADQVYLIDGAARLNAAFPLFEGVAGVSAVEWQLASLGFLPKPIPSENGPITEILAEKCGVSIRLYAEDPIRQLPSAGWIQEMTEVREWNHGDFSAELLSPHHAPSEVKTNSTGVIGELFVFAHDRKRALQAATRILSEFWISGSVLTNQKFSLEHLSHPFVRENLFHAGFTDDEFIPETNPDGNTMKRLVTIASRLLGSEQAKWIVGGLWVDPLTEAVEWLNPVQSIPSEKGMIYSGFARFSDGQTVRFSFFPIVKERWVCRVGLWQLTLRRVMLGSTQASGTSQNLRMLTSLVSGRVHALFKKDGAYCEPRSRLIVVESLGQLVQHAVVYPSKVTEWLVKPGDSVELGQDLARLELLR